MAKRKKVDKPMTVPEGGGVCTMCDLRPYGSKSVTKRCTVCNSSLTRAEANGSEWRIQRRSNLGLYTERLELVMAKHREGAK